MHATQQALTANFYSQPSTKQKEKKTSLTVLSATVRRIPRLLARRGVGLFFFLLFFCLLEGNKYEKSPDLIE